VNERYIYKLLLAGSRYIYTRYFWQGHGIYIHVTFGRVTVYLNTRNFWQSYGIYIYTVLLAKLRYIYIHGTFGRVTVYNYSQYF